jgi:putative membrane protein
MTTPEPKSANDLAAERTDLAGVRTLMAADRTLMAWIRTALSMISFGFTIYKLLEGFQQAGAALPHAQTPRNIGLFLTGLGTISMILGSIEYLGTLTSLRHTMLANPWRPSFFLAILMSVGGLFLFFGIITRLL